MRTGFTFDQVAELNIFQQELILKGDPADDYMYFRDMNAYMRHQSERMT